MSSSREDVYRGAADLAAAGRQHLVRVLSIFLVGLLGTILVLRAYLFDAITQQTLRRARAAGYTVETSFVNPFEVILLQAKIGFVVGAVLVLPFLVYGARDRLKSRGAWPTGRWARRRRLVPIAVLAFVLFVGGVAYAYYVMIPYMVQFVSAIAVEADITPFFRISNFMDFVLIYVVVFGFTAQLPLVMSFTVKSGMVSYDFYRSKWRYFVIVGAVLSALVTSPDPVTQVIVLGPMIGVYAVGLGVTRLVASDAIERQRAIAAETAPVEPAEADAAPAEEPPEPTASDDDEPRSDDAPIAGPGADPVDTGLLEVAQAVGASLKSNAMVLGGAFLAVTSVAFYWLVYYGIAAIRQQTVSYMPPDLASQVSTVQLRLFEVVFLVVKYSVLIGVVAVLPLVFHYARDALAEQGIVSERGSLWYSLSRGTLVAGLFLGGAAYAYFGMVPVLISLLSRSIVESGMLATFTISEFVNFVVLIALVMGVLAELPAAMYVLVDSKVVRFDTLRGKWRHFTVAVFGVGAFVTSPDPFTMVVVALPLSGFYLVSLGITRVVCHRTIVAVREERRRLGLTGDVGD